MTRGLHRANDLDTSVEAAWGVDAGELERMVLRELFRRAEGATIDELTQAIGRDKVALSPRLRPLCNRGLVRENGKRPGRSGRSQTVWVAVPIKPNDLLDLMRRDTGEAAP